jgi:hypothetical protein
MTDKAVASTTIDAGVQDCLAVVLDFERYPEWAEDIAEAVVTEQDDTGRGRSVRYRAEGFGRGTSYTLGYDYGDLPVEMRWSLVQGDIMRTCDGTYRFDEAGEDATTVTYELEIDLAVPLPGFIKRRAEERIVSTALRELKRRVEGPADA